MSLTGETFGDLNLALEYTSAHVVITVGGEIDLLTAPDLGAVIDTVVDRGHASVVVDLGDLTFIDGAGIQVFVDASFRLQAAGGELVLRATPAGPRHILDVTGVSDLVHYEPDPVPVPLGAEQRAGDRSRSVASQPRATPSDLARAAAIPASSDVVDSALRLVVALASATVDGADGVSVSLRRHGVIETVASSDETIAQMDRDQYATGEGPCLAAAAEGHWFHVASLADETRWPAFVPRARAGGIASILSTPLLVADRPVGALNIYSNAERAFGTDQQELAALFATQASNILNDAGIDISAEEAGKRLRDALQSREIIAQAQGVMMEREGVSADGAYGILRRSARRSEVALRRTALDVVASTVRGPVTGGVSPPNA